MNLEESDLKKKMIQPSNNWLSESKTTTLGYRQYLESNHWFQLKTKALHKANYQCKACKKTGNLHVHHLKYKEWYNCHIGDVVVLCSECHHLVHLFKRQSHQLVTNLATILKKSKKKTTRWGGKRGAKKRNRIEKMFNRAKPIYENVKPWS